MVPISLYDEIEIRKVKAFSRKTRGANSLIKVSCDHPLVPRGRKNIVYRAARLLMQKSGIEQPVSIHIHKRIPVGAGLGGGSSDAAATLVGLNRLLQIGYSLRKLKRLALTLGADVPFFINPRPVRARGIGDRLSPLPRFPRLWLVVLYPGFPVLTAQVYGKLRLKLTKPSVNTSIASSLRSFVKLPTLLVNDLEAVTLGSYPRIALLKEMLTRESAAGVLMSGSGSSVFGVFKSRRGAEKAIRRLRRKEGVQAFLVRVVS
jgi:4-diphosphocytidyl-2-C-methyl-D-erythritol kinase